jgi:hypothetical protein
MPLLLIGLSAYLIRHCEIPVVVLDLMRVPFSLTLHSSLSHTTAGYSFFIAAVVCQYSVILDHFFFELGDSPSFSHRRHVGTHTTLTLPPPAVSAVCIRGSTVIRVSRVATCCVALRH